MFNQLPKIRSSSSPPISPPISSPSSPSSSSSSLTSSSPCSSYSLTTPLHRIKLIYLDLECFKMSCFIAPISWSSGSNQLTPPFIASVQNTEYFKTLNTSKQLGYTQISACSSNQTEFWIQSSSVCNCFKILWLLLLWEYTHC